MCIGEKEEEMEHCRKTENRNLQIFLSFFVLSHLRNSTVQHVLLCLLIICWSFEQSILKLYEKKASLLYLAKTI